MEPNCMTQLETPWRLQTPPKPLENHQGLIGADAPNQGQGSGGGNGGPGGLGGPGGPLGPGGPSGPSGPGGPH